MSKELPYWQQRQQQKLNGPISKKEVRQGKEKKKVFFREKIAQSHGRCENCGKSLLGTIAINPKAIVAHILPKDPKSGCPSVATHQLNTWDACMDCHTNFDQKGAAHVQSMPVFNILKERVKLFYNEIDPTERRRVPSYFRPAK